MTTAPSLSFGLNLGGFQVSTAANADGLTTLQSDGLHIESGLPFYTGLDATDFYTIPVITAINGLEGYPAQTLTGAEIKNVALLAGEKLVIDFDYIPYDYRYNDFAFSILKSSSGAITPVLMGDVDHYLSNNSYPTHFTTTYTIGATGSYALLFGSSDAGDTLEPSDLIIHSVSIQVPSGDYTLQPGGVRLSDGTVLRSDGSALPPNGTPQPALLSGTASNLVSSLSADLSAGLISQDGGGLISQDGGGLISQDGSSVISNDGGSVISNDGGSLISQDGGGLISQDGGGLISQDGGGLISQDGSTAIGENSSGLISQDGGGIVGRNEYSTLSLDESGGLPRTFSSTAPMPPTGPGVPGTEFVVGPGLASGIYAGNEQVAALSDGKFAVAWFSGDGQGGDPTAVNAQVVNADGTSAGPTFSVSSAAGIDAFGNRLGIASLPGGGFAVTYADYVYGQTPPYATTPNLDVQLFNASGAAASGPVAVEPLIDSLGDNYGGLAATSLSDGTCVILETENAHVDATTAVIAQRVSASGTALGGTIDIGSGAGGLNVEDGDAILGLPNGAFAVAYTDATDARTFGLYVLTVTANGTQSTPVLIKADAQTGGPYDPAMALLTDGNIALAWNEPNTGIHVQVVTPAGNLVGAESVGETVVQAGSPPAITALSDGRFLVAYDIPTTGDLSATSVAAQIYNADGTPSRGIVAGSSTAHNVFVGAAVAAQLTGGTVEIVAPRQTGNGSYLASEPITLGGATATPTAQATQQGRAVDGYISGATVFADANGNGVLDAGEASATTDALGRYSFATPASGTVILTGGTDTSTGLAFTQTLTAPAGSLTVTPLTTLVQKIAAANGGNLQLAERQVNAEFGLPAATDVTALDPVRSANAGFADGAAAFVDGAIVADTAALAIAAGATGDVYGALAAQIAANPASFDVTSVAAMQALGLTGAAATTTSALAQASKALLTQAQTARAGSAQALLLAGAKIEKIAQGATSQALNAAVATQSFAPVLAAYTGAALASVLAGTTTPTPPSGSPTLTGGGVTATTDTVLGADAIIRSIPFGTAALAALAAPLLAGTTPSTLLAIDAGGSYAMSGANTAAVDDATDPVTLLGNAAANETIAAGAGAFAFQGGSGGGTVIGGAGADSIYLPGGGNWAVALGNGADTVVAVAGNETIATGIAGSFVFLGSGASSVASAGADTILGATGSSTVSALGAASDELFALGGPLVFIAGAGASTVVSGAVAATLFGGAGGGTLMFGDGATQYVGAGGTDTVVGLAGSMTAQGGAGGGLYFGGAQGNNVITAGAGDVTAFGAGAGDVLTATGSADDLFAGGVGAETLSGAGSTGDNTFFAGFGPETLAGGGGNTALVAGAGSDLLIGGSGLTLFLFVNGQTFAGADTIAGFDPSHDFVKLAGYAGDEATTVANASVVNGSSVIMLSDGTSITFAGVTQLNAGSFT